MPQACKVPALPVLLAHAAVPLLCAPRGRNGPNVTTDGGSLGHPRHSITPGTLAQRVSEMRARDDLQQHRREEVREAPGSHHDERVLVAEIEVEDNRQGPKGNSWEAGGRTRARA